MYSNAPCRRVWRSSCQCWSHRSWSSPANSARGAPCLARPPRPANTHFYLQYFNMHLRKGASYIFYWWEIELQHISWMQIKHLCHAYFWKVACSCANFKCLQLKFLASLPFSVKAPVLSRHRNRHTILKRFWRNVDTLQTLPVQNIPSGPSAKSIYFVNISQALLWFAVFCSFAVHHHSKCKIQQGYLTIGVDSLEIPKRNTSWCWKLTTSNCNLDNVFLGGKCVTSPWWLSQIGQSSFYSHESSMEFLGNSWNVQV